MITVLVDNCVLVTVFEDKLLLHELDFSLFDFADVFRNSV